MVGKLNKPQRETLWIDCYALMAVFDAMAAVVRCEM
jgi:hypothetical protein